MQIKSRVIKGYITIYLSLTFAILMPLLLALIEGAAAGTTRLQAELVADLGVDSIFAEYHKELQRQYGLFFIDDSYGASCGSVSQVEKHLEDYLSINTAEEDKNKITGFYNFQRLKKEYLEIEEVSFATDDACDVWKAQAIEYMKEKYGIQIVEDARNNLKKVEETGLFDADITQQIQRNSEQLKEIIEQRSKEEERDISFHEIYGSMSEWKGQGILAVILSDGSSISNAAFDKQKTVSTRYKEGACNKGSGIIKEKDRPQNLTDELLYDEYVMKKYGNYTNPKKDSCLSYETEYVLFGNEHDTANLRACAERLLLIREISNYIYLNTKDEVKKNEARAMSMAICSLCGVPELSEMLTQVTLGLWAYGESVIDVKTLFQGGKVSLMKTREEWNLSLTSLLSPNAWRNEGGRTSEKSTALSYEDYLRVFLGLMDKEEKILRSLDIVELDIRMTAGNENFRIDQCIDAVYVSFGFSDSYNHEYVFSREMRYE